MTDPTVPDIAQLNRFAVTLPGYEALTQTLYDTNAYAQAGQSTLSFFSVPVGQSSKTLSDTNMTLAGQIPANQIYLARSIEVPFYPTCPAVTAQNPAVYGAAAVAGLVNDAYTFYHGGNLLFVIGSKTYVNEAPLGRFPGTTHFHVMGALSDASTTVANGQSRIAYATSVGKAYSLAAPLRIEPNMSFSVTLSWPEGVQAITNPARVQVIIGGVLYRKAQ